MNICSHQRSLITVSSNSQFSISWARSAETARLGQWTWAFPGMKTVPFYHSLILKAFLQVHKAVPCLQMGSNEVQGGVWLAYGYFSTAGQYQWLERETTAQLPALQPFSQSASFQSMTAPIVPYLWVSKTEKNPWGGFFLASTFSHPNTFGNVTTSSQEDSIWWLSHILLMTKGLWSSDNKSNILPELYMFRNAGH